MVFNHSFASGIQTLQSIRRIISGPENWSRPDDCYKFFGPDIKKNNKGKKDVRLSHKTWPRQSKHRMSRAILNIVL